MFKKIPNYSYEISEDGTVINKFGKVIAESYFKNIRYVRLYESGKRHTLSVEKLVSELFDEMPEIPLSHNEVAFRYEDSSYFITNKCRVWNSKFKRWIKIINKNGYPTVNLSVAGRVESISIIKFLKGIGGEI